MGKGYLDDWDKFENWQKTGYKETVSTSSKVQYDLPWGSGGKSSYGGEKVYHTCYLTHPPLTIPGADKVIYGGSCSSPVVKDADVYIGFDWGMRFTKNAFPWNGGKQEFLFEIKDMNVPDDPAEFKKMVTWTLQQLDEGKKVHCGCIGGHGRTGTFLAALCAEAGEKDAISYVRKNYCKKAVESSKQSEFLAKHFGVTKVEGYKETAAYKSTHTVAKGKGGKGSGKKGGDLLGHIEKFSPMEQPFSIVGRARRN
jgi:hypothetical protein